MKPKWTDELMGMLPYWAQDRDLSDEDSLRFALAVALQALTVERNMTLAYRAWHRINKTINHIKEMGE